jgi:hypothetical protein
MGTALNLIVMGLCGARERSEEDWKGLLRQAGFKINGIWTDTTAAYENAIEVEAA